MLNNKTKDSPSCWLNTNYARQCERRDVNFQLSLTNDHPVCTEYLTSENFLVHLNDLTH